jgi:ferrous iron transport protein A
MVLLDVKVGSVVRIVRIDPGRGLENKLRQLGLVPGECVKIIRQAPFDGPFLITARGREIAIGKSVASKIMVEEQLCDVP